MLSKEEKYSLYMGSYNENKEYIDGRIADGIEKYRKGYCLICVFYSVWFSHPDVDAIVYWNTLDIRKEKD